MTFLTLKDVIWNIELYLWIFCENFIDPTEFPKNNDYSGSGGGLDTSNLK